MPIGLRSAPASAWRHVDVWGAARMRAPRRAKLFAGGSLALWLAVAILGRYLGYVPLTPTRLYSEQEPEQLLAPGGPLEGLRRKSGIKAPRARS